MATTPDPFETLDAKPHRAGMKTVSEEVDQLCDEFEKSWESWFADGTSSGEQPRVEQYVRRVREELREEARENLHKIHAALSAKSNPVFNSGEYEFVRLLGHGGMGYVSLARNLALNGQLVAIKTVKASFADLFNDREAKAGKLVHPNIVIVMKTGGTDLPYIVMEYIDGDDLFQLIEKRGPMSTQAACHLFQQVAQGLAHAHSENVLHRDVKPRNLMIDKSHKVKILDWGLAKHQDSEQTFHDASFGTWEYTAPEQMNGGAREADERSDLYSLGASLFFALTGFSPFHDSFYGESLNESRAAYMADRGLSQAAINQIECDDVRDLLLKLISPKEERPDDAFEIANHLQRLSGDSNASFIAYLDQSTRKRVRRQPPKPNRRSFLIAGTTATALVGGGILLAAFGRRIFPPSAERVQLAHDIVSSTGLRGEWWFEEIPMFSPPVRMAIFERILRGSNEEFEFYQDLNRSMQGDDVPEAYFKLADHSKEIESTSNADAELAEVVRLLNNITLESTDSAQYKKELNLFLDEIRAATRPEIVHLRANVRHYLATTSAERADAEQDYKEAVRGYQKASNRPLEVLAQLDFCQMIVRSPDIKLRGTSVENTIQGIDSHLTAVNRVTASCLRMRTRMYRTKMVDEHLHADLSTYRNNDDVRPISIHAAYIGGLAEFEHWHFAVASSELRAVRDDHLLVGEAYFFQLLWFDQLIAMSEFYMGHYQEAVDEFDKLIEDLSKHIAILKKTHTDSRLSLPQRAVVWHECRRLEERMPNLLERQADCHLFGTKQYPDAHDLLDKAHDVAIRLDFDMDMRARFVKRIETKRRLAKAKILEPDKVAQLALELFAEPEAAAAETLTAFQTTLDAAKPRDMNRDQLCSYLFCLQLWFDSPDFVPTRERVDEHVRKLLRILTVSPELTEFVRPCLLAAKTFYDSSGEEDSLRGSPRQRLDTFLSQHAIDAQANTHK